MCNEDFKIINGIFFYSLSHPSKQAHILEAVSTSLGTREAICHSTSLISLGYFSITAR